MSDVEVYNVYRIMVPDGKSYIGCSTNPQKRFNNHFYSKMSIGDAMRKYGKENCYLLIIFGSTDRKEALKQERELIAMYNTIEPNGYNVHRGGGGNKTKRRNLVLPEESIRDDYEDGVPMNEIINVHGVSGTTIRNRLDEWGVKRRPPGRQWKPIDITELLMARKSGMKVADICKKFGICKDTYYRRIKQLSA